MSDDDELLRRLAEAAREDEAAESARLDGRWDALSAGTLSPADEDALRREAETSMETRQAYEAFSPLGAEVRARIVRQARSSLGAEAAAVAPSTSSELPAPMVGRAPRGERPSRARRSWPAWAAAGLAAAALVLILRPGGERAALPEYSLSLRGAVREMRSAEPPAKPGAIPVFAPGNRFELVLTPRQPVEGRLAVQVLAGRAGDFHVLSAPVEISEQGAVRIVGRVGEEIELPPGETTLLVAVGGAGSLPSGVELLARLETGDRAQTESWAAWRLRVQVREER